MDTNEMTRQGTQKVQELKETAQNFKEKAQDLTQRARGTVRDAGAGADLYVHEYAWTSVLLVAAVAGIFGYLLGRQQQS